MSQPPGRSWIGRKHGNETLDPPLAPNQDVQEQIVGGAGRGGDRQGYEQLGLAWASTGREMASHCMDRWIKVGPEAR